MSIKVGVLGIGEHARRNILPALDECNSVKLVGLSGRNTEHLEKESQKYNCTAYVNPEDMLSDPKIDVVYIALPVGLHKEWGDRVLQAGKHLWCEKSLTHDPELSRQLISKAQQHDLCVCECFMYVHHPMFEHLKKIMRGKEIGSIRSITARFGFPHLSPDNIRYNKMLGGGALLDVGCYLLHAIRHLSNEQPDKIYSLLTREETYEVDTRGTALLGFPSGLQAHLEWGFGYSYMNEINIWAEKGFVNVKRAFSKPSDHTSVIEIWDTNGQSRNITIPPNNHFVSMFNNFAKACIQIDLRQLYLKDAEQQAFIMEKIKKH